MQRRTKILIAGGAVALHRVAPGPASPSPAAATTTRRRSPATRSTRRSRPRSTHTGEGRVTETEVGDEESYYEVEVTLDDGSQVDVQLDRSFNVVGSERRRGDRSAADDRLTPMDSG